MTRSKKIILFFLALLVGLTFSLSNLAISQKAKSQPHIVFTPFNGTDEDVYAAQIREVYEGKWFSGDAFVYETSHELPIYQWLGTFILGLMAKAIGSVSMLFIVADFIFPIIIFVLIFLFINLIVNQFWLSTIVSLSTLFLFQLINKVPPITKTLAINFWQQLTLKNLEPLFFNRLPAPQLTFTIFLLFLLTFYQALNNKNKGTFLTCGFLSGLLSYIYFYHWTASILMLAVAFGLNVLSRNKLILKKLWLSLCTATIVSAGYFYQLFASKANLIEKQILEGRIDGRFIEPLTTLRYGLMVLLILWLVREKVLKQLLLSIFISAVILVNLQLILGFTVSPGHWPNTTFEPLLVISAGILSVKILKKIKLEKVLNYCWVLILPIFLYGVLLQLEITHQWANMYYLSSEEKQLYDWFNNNHISDKVVLSFDKIINRRLPALTSQYLYLPYGGYAQIDVNELWERFDLAASIIPLEKNYISGLLDNQNFLAAYMFQNLYHFHSGSNLSGLTFPPEVIGLIAQKSRFLSFGYFYIPDNIRNDNLDKINQLGRIPLQNKICQYQLDYLVLLNKEKTALINPLNNNIFQLILSNNQLSLYQIKPDLCRL